MFLNSVDKCCRLQIYNNNLLVFIAVSLQPFFERDWELKVQFKIHGVGKKNLNGDGMAIWLTKDRMQNGRRTGSRRDVNMLQMISCNVKTNGMDPRFHISFF